jgi:hypothetical protein
MEVFQIVVFEKENEKQKMEMILITTQIKINNPIGEAPSRSHHLIRIAQIHQRSCIYPESPCTIKFQIYGNNQGTNDDT